MECLRRSHAFYKFHNHRQKIGIASVLHAEYDLQRIYMLQVYIISHIQDCKVPLKKVTFTYRSCDDRNRKVRTEIGCRDDQNIIRSTNLEWKWPKLPIRRTLDVGQIDKVHLLPRHDLFFCYIVSNV